jgi:outer membrane protein assembly factor BamB
MRIIGCAYMLIIFAYVIQSSLRFGRQLVDPKAAEDPTRLEYNLFRLSPEGPKVDWGPAHFYRTDAQRSGLASFGRFKSFVPSEVLDTLNVGVHSAVKSSPIGDDRRVFVGSDAGWFYAIDRLSKQVLWRIYLPGARRGIHSNPIVQGDRVWIGDYSGRLFSLSAESGEIRWFRQLGNTIGASPLLDGEFLYANVETTPFNGYLMKIEKRSGEVVWKSPAIGEQSHSSPAMSDDGRTLYLGANNKMFFAISEADGSILWRTELQAEVKGAPVFFEGQVYTIDMLGNAYVLNAANGKLVSTRKLNSVAMSSPALDRDARKIYFADMTHLYAFNSSGVILAARKINKRSPSSPVLVKEKSHTRLFMICEDKSLCEISSDLSTVRKIHDFGKFVTSTPLLFDDQIWVSLDEGGLFVLQGVN